MLRRLRPGRLVAYSRPEPEPGDGPVWREDEHDVDRWARLVEESLGIGVDRSDRGIQPPFEIRPDAAVVHPGASDSDRRWPAERFAVVAWGLANVGLDVVVTGSRSESWLVRRVARLAGLPLDAALPGSLDVVALTALLSSARVVVGGDTGVGHLATAVDTPSVLLFGPESPARRGPPPDGRHQVVHRPGVAARDLDVEPAEIAARAMEACRNADVEELRSMFSGRYNPAF